MILISAQAIWPQCQLLISWLSSTLRVLLWYASPWLVYLRSTHREWCQHLIRSPYWLISSFAPEWCLTLECKLLIGWLLTLHPVWFVYSEMQAPGWLIPSSALSDVCWLCLAGLSLWRGVSDFVCVYELMYECVCAFRGRSLLPLVAQPSRSEAERAIFSSRNPRAPQCPLCVCPARCTCVSQAVRLVH